MNYNPIKALINRDTKSIIKPPEGFSEVMIINKFIKIITIKT